MSYILELKKKFHAIKSRLSQSLVLLLLLKTTPSLANPRVSQRKRQRK